MNHLPPLYVNAPVGFLILNDDGTRGATSDVRLATPFRTFDAADTAAKQWYDSTGGKQGYFAILSVPHGPTIEVLSEHQRFEGCLHPRHTTLTPT